MAWAKGVCGILLHLAFAGASHVPRYCIDEQVLSIFAKRLIQCGVPSVTEEVSKLRNTNAIEYQRGSHELLAYDWLVQAKNPHRVSNCSEADLEYIPMLPLHWKVGSAPDCTYQALVVQITTYVAYRKTISPPSARIKFAVASTFNLRTEMGSGMQQQVRRGEQYDQVTSFVTSLYLGHYERWPQCPDLLRKGWLGIVELPYLALGEVHGVGAAAPAAPVEETQEVARSNYIGRPRPTLFFSAGRINQLYGPELVCSVRTNMASIYRIRNDYRMYNITQSDLSRGVQSVILGHFEKAQFCIIGKGDSYSSGTFYSGIAAGCIPVVISDWFVFAFPWIIPYSNFTIRFSETNWLMDPNACLNYLSNIPESDRKARRQIMFRYKDLLTFASHLSQSLSASRLQTLWMGEQRLQVSPTTLSNPSQQEGGQNIVLPFQLMLFELQFLSQNQQSKLTTTPRLPPTAAATSRVATAVARGSPNHIYAKIWSCETPFHCASNKTDFAGAVAPPTQIVGQKDTRSYFCTHAHRLIGQYKMVYNQGCVRILWPLRPGFLHPKDVKHLSPIDKVFVEHFHNISARPKGYLLFPYPVIN